MVTLVRHRASSILVAPGMRIGKGINLPTSDLRIPTFTDKDRQDLVVGLEEGVDFVALSFVRHERDLEPVQKILSEAARCPLLIGKIEKAQAVGRLEAILAQVDGLMVARGDLGVETPLEEVPIIQKKIIRIARQSVSDALRVFSTSLMIILWSTIRLVKLRGAP